MKEKDVVEEKCNNSGAGAVAGGAQFYQSLKLKQFTFIMLRKMVLNVVFIQVILSFKFKSNLAINICLFVYINIVYLFVHIICIIDQLVPKALTVNMYFVVEGVLKYCLYIGNTFLLYLNKIQLQRFVCLLKYILFVCFCTLFVLMLSWTPILEQLTCNLLKITILNIIFIQVKQFL